LFFAAPVGVNSSNACSAEKATELLYLFPPAGAVTPLGTRNLTKHSVVVLIQIKSAAQMSALGQLPTLQRPMELVGYVPCVDGSELARDFFTFAVLVGAAMCSAC